MLKKIHVPFLVLWFLTCAATSAVAEQATHAEAELVAERYLELLIHRFGGWGEHESARITDFDELRRGDRLLAYVFHVAPAGFLVVSATKELAAAKAHSASGRFDVDADGGVPLFVADALERGQLAIEARTGRSIHALTKSEYRDMGGVDYSPVWEELTSPTFEAARYEPLPVKQGGLNGMNYQEGEFLITSAWHQRDPYNRQTPAGTTCNHTVVGCVATAGVQIMRYWSWPPAASDGSYTDHYRWSSMPDIATASSSQEEIDAVSAASLMVANAVGMHFGCDGSSAHTYDMEAVLEHRRYDTAITITHRFDLLWGFLYTDSEWFQLIKDECAINRPVQYRVDGHSVIADGWYEVNTGTLERWWHMNYGWSVGDNMFYLMDGWPNSVPEGEYMVRGIRPDWDLRAALSGTYALPSDSGSYFDKPTRYIDQDASGANADFVAGHSFQYAPHGVLIRNTGTGSDAITFVGTPGAVTEFYRGAPDGDVKIRILDGAIHLKGGGAMALHH